MGFSDSGSISIDNETLIQDVAGQTVVNLDDETLHYDSDIEKVAIKGSVLLFVADVELTENGSVMDFPDLDINADGYYLLYIHFVSDSTGSNILMFANEDETATNYYNQFVQGNGSVVASDRANSPIVAQIKNQSFTVIEISRSETGKLSAGYRGNANQNSDSDLRSYYGMWSKNGTEANITHLRFQCVTANKMLAGTKATLYKLPRD